MTTSRVIHWSRVLFAATGAVGLLGVVGASDANMLSISQLCVGLSFCVLLILVSASIFRIMHWLRLFSLIGSAELQSVLNFKHIFRKVGYFTKKNS